MPYTQETVHEITVKQRQFFRTGVTLDVNWRIEQLKKLRQAVLDHQALLEVHHSCTDATILTTSVH